MPASIINDEEVWDRFVDNSPYGTLFHKWKFLKIMEKYSRYQLLPYGIFKGKELACLFPLFYKAEKGLRFVASPPRQSILYVPYLGYVMSREFDGWKQHKKESFTCDIVHDINREISRLSPNYTSIFPVPRCTDMRPFRWSGYTVDLGYTYITNLERTEEELWNSLTSNCRKDIRDLKDKSLQFKAYNDVDRFFEVMRSVLAQEGPTFFHAQTPEYLKEIIAAFPENVKMNALYEDDTPLYISTTIEYNGRLLMWMAGSASDRYNSGECFVWELLKDASRRGLKVAENWGTEQRRLCNFKSKFNPSLEMTCIVRKTDGIGKLATMTYNGVARMPLLSSIIKA
ncbi:GNAT family N-acetyltransferase [Methanocella arvoryzae]|uniref:BioF2-like acetyltransferase domain-containing protein n=1 Tax=Methanocella arvoryzae (strain DSM 22066 / NBRC 105507 / MRE50) TaxID=351160 RepID=Q0W2V5_METAR|nr:GNAT family N-acetyltransferase [Methanocella arvoryzae]CAJ37288.1 hypothetical protein RCIX2164 [Methanocella arvoryzae MRE50]